MKAMRTKKMSNVSLRKEAEEAKKSRIVDAIPQAVVSLKEGQIIFSNKAVETVFGWRPQELLGKSLDVLDKAGDAYDRFIDDLKGMRVPCGCSAELSCVRRNGQNIECICKVSALRPAKGRIKREIVITYEDITKQKLSNTLFDVLSQTSPVAFFVIQEGKFVYANPQGYRDTGLTQMEIIGKDSLSFVHQEDAVLLRQNSRKALAGEKVLPFEFRIVNKEGRVRWVLGAYFPFLYRGKQALLGHYIDISKTKETEELYKTLNRSSQICFFVVQDGKFVYTNPKGAQDSGFTADELAEKDSRIFIHPEDKEMVREKGIRMLKGEHSSPIEFRYVNKAGKVRWAIGLVTPIEYKGRPAVLGNYVDITERKMAEMELEHSREQLRDLTAHLQSVREDERTRVASEIHDELGQILTIIKMDLSWLTKHMPQNQAVCLEKTRDMSKLLDSTIQTVKRISMELRPGLLDHLGLTASLEWQAKEFTRKTGIHCETTINQDIVIRDPKRITALSHIFQEILNNVYRHAGAAKIEIELKEKDDMLMLGVRDNGRGITMEQIANPGSFGIIGMRERVRSMGGSMEIHGSKKKGTVVTVKIPVDHKDHSFLLRILIADFHPIFREGLKRILAEARDMVICDEVANARDLVEKVSRNNYDVVLLDFSMMVKPSLDILKEVKAQNPTLPVLVLSIYPEEQYAVRVFKAGASGYLTKETCPR